MRIIGGSARGRRLFGPQGGSRSLAIRPTSDRAREAVFNKLASAAHGTQVLDLFAGTGAMGLEALSRGADAVIFIDNTAGAIQLIKKNIELCSFQEKAVCRKMDLTGSLSFIEKLQSGRPFDLVFLDPPYNQNLTVSTLEKLSRLNVLAAGAKVVAEVRSKERLPEAIARLTLDDQRSYGEAGFWFYLVSQEKN